MDQWDYEGVTLSKYFHHQLSINDLVDQHNDSRLFIPRIIALAYAPLTGWDIRYEVGLAFLCSILLAVGINCLILRDRLLTRSDQLCGIIITNVSILACTQWEVYLFGAYYFIVPGLALVWALVVKHSSWSYPRKISAWIVLSLVATFCYVTGVLTWLFVAACLFLPEERRLNIRQKAAADVCYCVVAAITIVAYFITYKRPPWHPSLAATIVDPYRMFAYYLTWLGAPLGHGGAAIPTSEVAGAILLVLFVIAGTHVLIRFRSMISGSSYPWLIICAFVLTTGICVSVGRSAFGIEQALASRYHSFSLLFLPSLFLLLLVNRNLIVEGRREAIRTYSLAAISFITGAGSILFLLSSTYGLADARSYSDERLRARLAVEFATVIPDNPQLNLSHPSGEKIARICQELLPHHLPHLTATGERIRRVLDAPVLPADGRSGFLDRAIELGDGSIAVAGWAILETTRIPADGVLMVWKGDNGMVKPVAILPLNAPRPDVEKALGNNRVLWSGFNSSISNSNIPGAGEISAWAVDTTAGKACHLAGTFRVRAR
jgi:hypothetical protein